jgi:hypothetical protein
VVNRFLGGIVGLIGVFWLFLAGLGAMYWWDHAETRPAWTQAHFLFLHFPDWLREPSLAMRLEAADASFNTERHSFQIVDRALSLQNGRIRALGDLEARTLARAEKATGDYDRLAATASKARAINAQPVMGDDECARVKSADAHLLDALR